jgi:pyruvate kinase
MRRARIICTLGPSTDSPSVLEGMIRAGMDVARFNFSHGTWDDHRRRFDLLQKLAKRQRRAVAVMQDVQGPKIRLGLFEAGQMPVRAGQTVTITTRDVVGQAGVIPTPVQSLPKDVRKGDPVLLDDGRVRLEVLRVRGSEVTARVLVGGILRDRKGLNLPGTAVSVPSVTEKDEEDLAFGQRLGVDYVALSFVRSAADVERARPLVSKLKTPLIAKIEKPQAVENLAEIARVSDGVMVARGDLGVELPLEKLPAIQKQAVSLVNHMGGLVIVATEMLESMILSARPTRAEVTDVANAVLDGADAVMLSGETAAGQFPVQAVTTMCRIVEEIEVGGIPAVPHLHPPIEQRVEISSGVAAAAVAAAHQLGCELIATYTESGYTARLISELRPRARIVALTPHLETVRRMALYWGVEPMLVPRLTSTDAMVSQVKRLCAQRSLCRTGAPAVIVAGVPLNVPGNTNLMTIHRI